MSDKIIPFPKIKTAGEIEIYSKESAERFFALPESERKKFMELAEKNYQRAVTDLYNRDPMINEILGQARSFFDSLAICTCICGQRESGGYRRDIVCPCCDEKECPVHFPLASLENQ